MHKCFLHVGGKWWIAKGGEQAAWAACCGKPLVEIEKGMADLIYFVDYYHTKKSKVIQSKNKHTNERKIQLDDEAGTEALTVNAPTGAAAAGVAAPKLNPALPQP